MITDFGVAKAIALATGAGTSAPDSTGVGVAIGTPAYMAPEQAVGDPAVDHRVDLYALGVVAYELLTGGTPFVATNPYEFLAAHLTATPVPIRERRPDIPEPMAALVMRLLAKRPEDRPQSASEVIAELDRLSAGTVHGSRHRLPWKPVAVMLTIAVLGGAILFNVTRSRARSGGVTATDGNAVTVAPFRVAGAESSLRYLREGMLDLLAAKLSGEGGVRAVDPRTVVNAWTRASGDASIDLPIDDARAVAARIGSGQLILGTVVGTPARLTINADVVDVSDGETRAQATVHGSADSLTALVDGLAARLLSLRAGEDRQRLANLTSTSLPALQAYLEGAYLYRRGRYQEAARRYERALELDTTFALAAIGVGGVTGWGADADGPRANRLAWLARGRLSPRDRALLSWQVGPRYPAPSSYAERFGAAERLAQLAPDSPESWYAVGDAFYHYGKPLNLANALERAARALERALQLDSSYAPALQHLPIIYYELGDTSGVREAAQRFIDMSPESEIAQYLRWFAALALGDSSRIRRFRSNVEALPFISAWFIELTATELGVGLHDAARAIEVMDAKAANPGQRQAARSEARSFHLNGGRPTVAARYSEIPAAERPWARSLPIIDAMFWDGDSAAARQAIAELQSHPGPESLAVPNRSDGNGLERVWAIFALAQWQMEKGDVAMARRAIPRLRSFRAPPDSAWLEDLPRSLALVLDAQAAAAEGRRDAAALRARLDSLGTSFRVGTLGDYYGQAMVNLVLARLWEASGEVRRAYMAVQRVGRGGPIDGLAFYSTFLREEGRLAARLGERDASVRAYRHYLALREDAEPRFATEVARIRAELTTSSGGAQGSERAVESGRR